MFTVQRKYALEFFCVLWKIWPKNKIISKCTSTVDPRLTFGEKNFLIQLYWVENNNPMQWRGNYLTKSCLSNREIRLSIYTHRLCTRWHSIFLLIFTINVINFSLRISCVNWSNSKCLHVYINKHSIVHRYWYSMFAILTYY